MRGGEIYALSAKGVSRPNVMVSDAIFPMVGKKGKVLAKQTELVNGSSLKRER
jgi:hypothetical protein